MTNIIINERRIVIMEKLRSFNDIEISVENNVQRVNCVQNT